MNTENGITIQDNTKIDAFRSADFRIFQHRIQQLLTRRTSLYTSGESSSIPKEIAQELLNSICFVLNIDLDGDPKALGRFVGIEFDIEDAFDLGIKEIEEKIAHGKMLWQAACMSMPEVDSMSLKDTLKGIGSFWKKYDYDFFAHQIPCYIDYQLCHPLPETLQGVDYINSYLERILIENNFIRRFDTSRSILLFRRFSPNYRELLINLYEIIATNALGLALIDGDILNLNISEAQQQEINALLSTLPPSEMPDILKSAVSRLCYALSIQKEEEKNYLERFIVADLYPRIISVLENGHIDNLFIDIFR